MMSAVFEESFLDFDLTEFQPSSNNAVICADKACKAITKTKRKIISTDLVINRYKTLCLDHKKLQKSFISSKEEHKQACIDTMEYREKCLALDKVIKDLQLTIKNLELNCVTAQNKHDGMQSHAKQLEQLVKENETTIESLKIQNLSEKAINAKLQKEKEQLSKNMCYMRNFVLGKKKLPKGQKSFVLTHVKKSADDALDSEEIIRCDDLNTFDEVLSPDFEIHNDKLQHLALPLGNLREYKNTSGSELRSFDINEGSTYTKVDHDHDEDDGRGSSIAFSDSDKCFNSPEYFINSPFSGDFLRSKNKLTANVSTSPLPMNDVRHVATSPIIFKSLDILDGIEKIVSDEITAEGGARDNNRTGNMIDRVLSPCFVTHYVNVATSPLNTSTNDAATSPLKQDGMSNCYNQQDDQNTQEKYLMDINNSSCLEDENSNDCEVQMIFDSMRFNQKLITPIPTTPAKSRNLEASTDTAAQTMNADFLNLACVPTTVAEKKKYVDNNMHLSTTVAEIKKYVDNNMHLSTTVAEIKEYVDNNRHLSTTVAEIKEYVDNNRHLSTTVAEIKKYVDNNMHLSTKVRELTEKVDNCMRLLTTYTESKEKDENDMNLPTTVAEVKKNVDMPMSKERTENTPHIISADRTAVLFEPEIEDRVLVQNTAPMEISKAIDNNAIRVEERVRKLKKLNSILFADSSPPSPSDAALLSPPSPSAATLPSPPHPRDVALISPPRPSDATLPSPPRPRDVALISPPSPSDAALPSPPRTRDSGLISPPRRSDAALPSPPRPTDDALHSPPSLSYAALLSPPSPSDAALPSPPRPTDDALLSPPSPSDAALPSPPRPRDAALISPPRPRDAALPSPPRHSDAALLTPASPSDAALPLAPRPSHAALLSPPSPSDAALPSPPRASDAALLSPPSPSDAALSSPPRTSDAALLSPPSPSDAALLSPPNPSDAAPPSPHPSPLTLENNDVDNSNTYYGEDICLKENETLQFEVPISSRGSVKDRALSDSDVYEREIVIELPPDTLESDTNSLHEMLKKQDSKQPKIHEEVRNKNIPKKKNITKLEKLRQRMLPKSKIKYVDVQINRRKRTQPKRLNTNGDRISVSQISHNTAYEKACKVMSELRSKEKNQKKDYLTVLKPKLSLSPKKGTLKTFKRSELIINDLFNNKNLQESCIQTQNQGIGQGDLSKFTSAIIPVKLNKPLKSIYEICNTKICKEPIEKNKTPPELAPNLENSQDFQNNSRLPGQRIIRTRSQSKSTSHDVSMTRKPEINSDPGQPPVSPKMYGKNRRKSKDDESSIYNNTIVGGLIKSNIVTVTEESNGNSDAERMAGRTTLKRKSVEVSDSASKRILRSSSVRNYSTEPRSKRVIEKNEEMISRTSEEMVTYGDIDIFEKTEKHTNERMVPRAKKYGIFCHALDRYCRKSKTTASKLTENAINFACKTIEDGIAEIRKLPDIDQKVAMDKLVKNLQGLRRKQTLAGIIQFLKEPARKIELQYKKYESMAPPLTEAESILIYIVSQFKVMWPDIVENIMSRIEHSLFSLNRSPDFGVIETLAHFYAVLCRYDDKRTRLRMFIMDAMYCMQFKALPLIKQCMEVDMKIFPLAHMAKAKESLVTCLVYLLHFYKCDDKKNTLQDIRNLFHRKYFYDMSEWNEPRILEMFRNSIMELSDLCAERKMLHTAFILLAKRNGALWCQNNIIQNMLLPIIEQPKVPDRVKQFCVSLLGALLKPYPIDMRVNCEIVMNQLFAMLSRNPSNKMVEAIFTSLIHMSKHNPNRVIKALFLWKPARISPELEMLLKNFVKERPLKSWRTIISKFSVQQT